MAYPNHESVAGLGGDGSFVIDGRVGISKRLSYCAILIRASCSRMSRDMLFVSLPTAAEDRASSGEDLKAVLELGLGYSLQIEPVLEYEPVKTRFRLLRIEEKWDGLDLHFQVMDQEDRAFLDLYRSLKPS